MWTKTVLPLAIYSAVALSCRANDPGATTSVATAPQPVSASAASGSPGPQRPSVTYGEAKPTIRLIEPGATPHRELTFRPAQVARHVRLSLGTPPPGQPDAERKTALVLSWKTDPTTKSRYQFHVTQASMTVSGPAAKATEQTIHERIRAGFEQVAGYASVPSSDHITIGQTQGAATTPSVPLTLHLLAVYLPAQPIGVGARWELSEPASAPGGKGEATRVYELLALTAQGATVRITRTSKWTQQRGSQQVTGSSRFTGQAEIHFNDLLPQSATATLVSSVSLPLGPDDDSPPVETTTAVRLEPK